MKFNEGLVCDGIIRMLEARTGTKRSNLKEHDKDPDLNRRVEVTFNLGDQFCALEHTGIEPFDHFIELNNTADRILDPIKDAVANKLPAGDVFDLQMPALALQGYSKKELRPIQEAVARWVIETAPTLERRPYGDYKRGMLRSRPPGVPFDVVLRRFDGMGFTGRLQIVNSISSDLEAKRKMRIEKACEDKCPKLAAWKASNGARTILALEDVDFQVSSVSAIAEAFLAGIQGRKDVPDETYLMTTREQSPTWYVWPLMVNGNSYYKLSETENPIYFEIEVPLLTPATRR
jgi:hypothetical protein